MKTAILLGATGLVGGKVLELLLQSEEYSKIILFTRIKLDISEPKVEQHIINFEEIDLYKEFIKGNDFFNCLGTTLKKAGSQEKFLQIDFEYPIKFAQLAKNNGIQKILSVSSIGANSKSSNYYLKAKGLLEDNLQELEFPALYIFRPSILLGKRKESRLGESISKILISFFSLFLIGKLKKYKGIQAEKVAQAMYHSAQKKEQGIFIYESDEIQKF